MYYDLLYEIVEKNEELKSFFLMFSKYYEMAKSYVEEETNKEIQQLQPQTKKVYDIINLFDILGVDIQNTVKCLDIQQYMNNENKAIDIFGNITFNRVSFNQDDVDDLIKKYSSDTQDPNYVYLAEKQYKEWLKKNKNIEKQHKFLKKRHQFLKLNDFGSAAEDDALKDLIECEIEIENGTKLKQKVDLLHNFGQRTRFILELFDRIDELYQECISFNNSKNQIYEKYNLILEEKIEESFNRMISESLVEIDVKRITKMLFKEIMMVNARKKGSIQEQTDKIKFELTKCEFDMNMDAVDWFVGYKSQEILELMNLMFDGYEIVVTDLKEKIKAKTI